MKTNFFKNKNILTISAICLLAALIMVGGTLAYLIDSTETLSNEFIPAKVTCEVEEVFENGVKENVAVRNTGNIDAYVRATVVASFISDDGKVLAKSPEETIDYTVTWNSSDWTKGADGYWYYKTAVIPDSLTLPLIERTEEISAPDGYSLNIQIIATAIQSNPQDAVKEAWGVDITDGEITPN